MRGRHDEGRRPGDRVVLLGLGAEAERADGRVARELEGDRPHEDQGHGLGRVLAPGQEGLHERAAALLHVDPADVEEVGPREPVLPSEPRRVGVRDRIDPRPDDGGREVFRVEALLDEGPLLLDLEDESARDAEQAPEEVEVDGPLVVGRRTRTALWATSGSPSVVGR